MEKYNLEIKCLMVVLTVVMIVLSVLQSESLHVLLSLGSRIVYILESNSTIVESIKMKEN